MSRNKTILYILVAWCTILLESILSLVLNDVRDVPGQKVCSIYLDNVQQWFRSSVLFVFFILTVIFSFLSFRKTKQLLLQLDKKAANGYNYKTPKRFKDDNNQLENRSPEEDIILSNKKVSDSLKTVRLSLLIIVITIGWSPPLILSVIKKLAF